MRQNLARRERDLDRTLLLGLGCRLEIEAGGRDCINSNKPEIQEKHHNYRLKHYRLRGSYLKS